jgi:predicted AAA+ superfamily ATPase
MLNTTLDNVPNYFTFDRNEIDFVIQNKNRIIPIEVKANKSTNNTSLTRYNEKFDNDISIRFSMNNLIKDGRIINIPLFLIEYMENFIQF